MDPLDSRYGASGEQSSNGTTGEHASTRDQRLTIVIKFGVLIRNWMKKKKVKLRLKTLPRLSLRRKMK